MTTSTVSGPNCCSIPASQHNAVVAKPGIPNGRVRRVCTFYDGQQ